MFAQLPKGVSTPELKIEVAEGEQYRFIEEFVAKAKFEGARMATIDGLRADWPDGWGLVRASNTTPTLVLRFDAKDAEALERVQAVFREQMLAIDPGAEAAVLSGSAWPAAAGAGVGRQRPSAGAVRRRRRRVALSSRIARQHARELRVQRLQFDAAD